MSEGRMLVKIEFSFLMTINIKQNPSIENENWDMVIEPQRSLLDLRLGELWRYKDLVMLFVRRDFVSVYKQTILGPLWYLIQPLLTTITFTVKTQVGGATVFTKTVGSGITISTDPTNRFTVAVAAANTSSEDPGDFKYDCQVTLASMTRTVARGVFQLVGDVS